MLVIFYRDGLSNINLQLNLFTSIYVFLPVVGYSNHTLDWTYVEIQIFQLGSDVLSL